MFNSSLSNSTILDALKGDNSSGDLVSLDDYLTKILPLHFQNYFLEDLEAFRQHTPSEYIDGLIKSLKAGKLSEFPLNTNFIKQFEHLKSLSSGSTFSSLSFTQGLIIGQVSVIIIFALFMRFFIFSEGSSRHKNPPVIAVNTNNSKIMSNVLKRGGKNRSEIKSSDPSIDDNQNEMTIQINNILQKTYYDVNTHKHESLDWFNVLIAQIIQQFRDEAYNKNNILNSLNLFMQNNSTNLPDYLDTIKVTELDIGDDFPIFSNCRIKKEKRKLEAKIDIDLIDRLSLGIETKLLLNYPKPGFMALPISLTVAIIRFQGCLTVSLTKGDEFVQTTSQNEDKKTDDEDNDQEDNSYFLMFSFSPEYKFEFDTESLIGARSKLENIPRIRSLIEYQIKKWFVERCVEPRFQFIKLPNIWPRSKNTREEKHNEDDTAKTN
ncbi:similar to Saccharomyces cerevisiae YLL006W MMM1 ER integral membrane protein [Maudiozyma saulgeensis]|uniref:Maintenance of mitochondrial morphology protein 1 n=1 Tax=Maudiozyma saulgeensis TaxID=1789683 RepID=A0A1X7QXL4_9SACH|nr:similar to Saccharomyces cerevisiae YLL006W MMM1 ER integral membrane protein [Kazachstania saulgeensis]